MAPELCPEPKNLALFRITGMAPTGKPVVIRPSGGATSRRSNFRIHPWPRPGSSAKADKSLITIYPTVAHANRGYLSFRTSLIRFAQPAARSSSPSFSGPSVPFTQNPSGGSTRSPPFFLSRSAMGLAA